MGDDFSSHKVFSAENPVETHARLHSDLPHVLSTLGFRSCGSPEKADRTIAIGPPERWVHIGDSCGSTGEDIAAFLALGVALSAVAPVATIQASDSAAVRFSLQIDGKLVDQYANMAFPFFYFKTEKEAAPFKGRTHLWREFLVDPTTESNLRSLWAHSTQSDPKSGEFFRVLNTTASLFGMNQDFLEVGYTNDMEGIGLSYHEFLPSIGINIDGFTDFHFRTIDSAQPVPGTGSPA